LCAFFESEDDEIGDDFKSNDFFEILESESGSTEVSESDPFWDSNDLFKSESDFKANDFFEVLESEFDEDSDPLKDWNPFNPFWDSESDDLFESDDDEIGGEFKAIDDFIEVLESEFGEDSDPLTVGALGLGKSSKDLGEVLESVDDFFESDDDEIGDDFKAFCFFEILEAELESDGALGFSKDFGEVPESVDELESKSANFEYGYNFFSSIDEIEIKSWSADFQSWSADFKSRSADFKSRSADFKSGYKFFRAAAGFRSRVE
jgi:hypothetical protein